MTVLSKVRALLERAAHPETPVEEARTSAVLAAKIIVEKRLEIREIEGFDADRIGKVDVRDVVDEWFSGVRRKKGRPKKRKKKESDPEHVLIHVGSCLPFFSRWFRCACCGQEIRTGQLMAWVERPDIQLYTPVTHQVCSEHWLRPWCRACGRARGERAHENGLAMPASSNGYCFCCGQGFSVGDPVLQLGYTVVHERCAGHFRQSPCSACGGTAGF